MRAVLSIAFKDLRLMRRDKAALFFTLGFPLVFGLLFGFIYGGTTGTPSEIGVAVVDLDRSEASGSFRDALIEDDVLEVHLFEDVDRAAASVRHGELRAVVVIEPGFGEGVDRVFVGGRGSVRVVSDPASPAAGAMVTGLVTRVAGTQLAAGYADPEWVRERVAIARDEVDAIGLSDVRALSVATLLGSVEAALSGIGLEDATDDARDAVASDPHPAGGIGLPIVVHAEAMTIGAVGNASPASIFAITFSQAMVWGMMGCAATFASSMSEERSMGTLVRLRVSPLSTSGVLLGKALACFIGCVVVSSVFLTLSIVALGVRPVSWVMLTLGLLMASLAFSGLMLLIASVARSRVSPSQLAWGLMLVLALLGGGMLPLEFMPDWMRTASHVSPVKWAILGIEGGIWRAFTPTQMLGPAFVLLAIAAFGFWIGSAVLSRVPLRL